MDIDEKRVIVLNGVVNARDLGGIKTVEGYRIRRGLLFRSGMLYEADAEDVKHLKSLGIRMVADFRGTKERIEKPDVYIGEERNLHLPVIRERNLAVERTEKLDLGRPKGKEKDFMLELALKDPMAGETFMKKAYRDFIADEYQVSIYTRFVQAVLETTEGAVLWHCAGGKDRAGFAAIVLLALLGVSREEIRRDYLLTNRYNGKDIEGMIRKVREAELPEDMDREAFLKTMLGFCAADERYFDTIFETAGELYGDFDAYIEKGLKIRPEDRAILRARYLEEGIER